MSSLNHICTQGETWGFISNYYYGSMAGIKTIIAANPTVPIDPVLPHGTTLIIPILENTDEALIRKNLPPWK